MDCAECLPLDDSPKSVGPKPAWTAEHSSRPLPYALRLPRSIPGPSWPTPGRMRDRLCYAREQRPHVRRPPWCGAPQDATPRCLSLSSPGSYRILRLLHLQFSTLGPKKLSNSIHARTATVPGHDTPINEARSLGNGVRWIE